MKEYKKPCEDCWHFRPNTNLSADIMQRNFGKCNKYGDDFTKSVNANYASTSRKFDWNCGQEGKWFDSLLEVL